MKIETASMKRAKEEIVSYLIWWLELHEAKGSKSIEPVHFGANVVDDNTLRDLVELARGR